MWRLSSGTFLRILKEQGNDCLCDCLSLNNTNNLPTFSLSPTPPTFLNSKPRPLISQTQQNSASLFASVTPSCASCLQRLQLLVCVHVLTADVYRMDVVHLFLWLSLEAIFVALPPCCVFRTLKLSLGNKRWSLIGLPPPPLLFTPVVTLPTRCSWSVSSSLLQPSCK